MSIAVADTILQVSYHHIPHMYLGSLCYFQECQLYIFFPKLYDPDTRRTFLTNREYERFINLLLNIMHKVYDSGVMQHFPSSWADASCKARAQGREQGIRTDTREPRSQMLHYVLPPHGLNILWNRFSNALSGAGFQDLAEPQLLLSAKNMKTLFRSSKPNSLIQQFLSTWNFAIDANHLLPNATWIDLGKEVIPPKVEGNPSQTYLWRECCLRKTLHAFQLGIAKAGFQSQCYPWALTRDTCNMTFVAGKKHPFRTAGLMYSQFYSSTKEIFDAAKVFPFDNSSLEGLAVDPTLHQLWNKDSGYANSTWDRQRVRKSFLAGKERVHTALKSSIKKCYGTREEHRMSWCLFEHVGRAISQISDIPPVESDNPPFQLVATKVMSRFLYSNVLKFGYGFEYAINKDGGKYVTTESTKVATMFLQLLRTSLGGSLLQANSALWIDIGITMFFKY